MELPKNQWIYKYWVELRNLHDGSVRNLPLTARRRIHIPTEKNAPALPDEVELRLEDNEDVIEGRDIDSVATQLRKRYADADYERILRCERDLDAETRKVAALDGLIEILAKAAFEDHMKSQGLSSTPNLES